MPILLGGTTTAPPPPAVAATDDVESVVAGAGASLIDVLSNDTGINLTISNVTLVSGGGVAVESSGRISYTPPATAGTAEIDYTATDGLTSDVGRLTVTINAAPPAVDAVNDTATAVATGPAVSIDVLANDVGTGLSIINESVQSGGGSVAVVSGQLEYTPPATAGPATLQYTATDGVTSDTATVAVTIEAGITANDDTETVTAGTAAVLINVLSNDVGSGLTITNATIQSGGGSAQVVSNQIEFTPPVAAGTTVVRYTATDGISSDTADVTITVNAGSTPVAPSIAGTPFPFINSVQGLTPYSFSYDHPGGTNQSLLVLAALKKGNTNIGDPLGMAVDYGGQTVPVEASASADGFGAMPTARIFRLPNAPTGTNTLTLTPTCAEPIDSASIVVISLVDDLGIGPNTGSIEAPQPPGDQALSGTFDVDVTQPASLLIGQFAVRNSNNVFTLGAGFGLILQGDTDFSASTDHAFLVQSLETTVAGLPAFDASWTIAETFSGVAIEILGAP